MDAPFILPVKGGDFVTVPYTFHMSDIVSYPFEGYNPAARKNEIADRALKTLDKTPYLDRGPAQKTGLSGPSA
jgi:hypothetical protein